MDEKNIRLLFYEKMIQAGETVQCDPVAVFQAGYMEGLAMTNHMTWTTTRPTQPGTYWWRIGKRATVLITLVFVSDQSLYASVWGAACANKVENMVGEWAGPIPEPVERDERESQP